MTRTLEYNNQWCTWHMFDTWNLNPPINDGWIKKKKKHTLTTGSFSKPINKKMVIVVLYYHGWMWKPYFSMTIFLSISELVWNSHASIHYKYSDIIWPDHICIIVVLWYSILLMVKTMKTMSLWFTMYIPYANRKIHSITIHGRYEFSIWG